ncbi:MAG: hypothetical protein VB120_07685 [Lachnospiraceae bacterium]|nr:hypothetical protein [Lachnospiraceae bacterium]
MDIKKTIKKSGVFAVAIGFGNALGGVVIPRLTRPWLYNETYPSIFVQALLSFAVGFAVSFSIYMLIEWIKSKLKN